jgi:hypothetical protein
MVAVIVPNCSMAIKTQGYRIIDFRLVLFNVRNLNTYSGELTAQTTMPCTPQQYF